jgi:hypothetical protein
MIAGDCRPGHLPSGTVRADRRYDAVGFPENAFWSRLGVPVAGTRAAGRLLAASLATPVLVRLEPLFPCLQRQSVYRKWVNAAPLTTIYNQTTLYLTTVMPRHWGVAVMRDHAGLLKPSARHRKLRQPDRRLAGPTRPQKANGAFDGRANGSNRSTTLSKASSTSNAMAARPQQDCSLASPWLPASGTNVHQRTGTAGP